MIDNNACFIGLEDFSFLNPQISSNKKLYTWIKQAFTLGGWSPSPFLLKERQIDLLKKQQLGLQLQLINAGSPFAVLASQIDNIAKSIREEKSIALIEADIKKVEKNFESIKAQPLVCNLPLNPLAMETFNYLGYLFANLVTLGFYGVVKAELLQSQFDLLTAQNAHLVTKTQKAFVQAQNEIRSKINHLNQQKQHLCNSEEFRSLPEYSIWSKTQKLQKELISLERDHQSLQFELEQLIQQEEKSKKEIVRALPFQKQLEALIETLKGIKTLISEKQKQLLGPLPPRFENYNEDLKAFEQYFDQQKKINPLFNGDYGLNDNENDKTRMTAYAKLAKQEESKTPSGLMKTLFHHVFVTQLSKKGWLQSKEMLGEAQEEKRKAVYHLMALELIKAGTLVKIDCHGYGLRISNDESMTLCPSLPEVVQRSKEQGGYSSEMAIIFKRLHNPFTPPVNDPQCPYGIDPVSAALIYRKHLSAEQRHYVEVLLSEHLLSQNDPDLLNAKSSLKKIDGQLIAQAVTFISEIGHAIGKNFSLVLDAEWQTSATLSDAISIHHFTKKEDPHSFYVIPEMHPNVEKTIKSMYNNLSRNYDFHTIFNDLKCYQKVFDAIHSEAILCPLDQPFPACITKTLGELGAASAPEKSVLNYQYHISGSSFNSDFMTKAKNFGMLARFILSQHQMIYEDFYHLMAVYLDTSEGKAALFSILEKYQIDDPNYIETYCKQFSDDLFYWEFEGDSFSDYYRVDLIDLEVFAHMLGIRIGVFTPDTETKINEMGLQVPKDDGCYVGPFTKETHYIYLDDGLVYPMWPKLKIDAFTADDQKEVANLELHWSQEYIHGGF